MREEMLKDEGRLALSMFYLGYALGQNLNIDEEIEIDSDVFFGEEIKKIAFLVSEKDSEKVIMSLANLARTRNMTTIEEVRHKLLTDNMLRKIADVSARVPLHGSNGVDLDAVAGLHRIIGEYLEERGGN